jgi:hypothetical protein
MRSWALIYQPGVSTERQSLFLAPYRSADRISDGGGVKGEHEESPLLSGCSRSSRPMSIKDGSPTESY